MSRKRRADSDAPTATKINSAATAAVMLAKALLRRDHRQARGRTDWRVIEVAFTGFPAAIPEVTPGPLCQGTQAAAS